MTLLAGRIGFFEAAVRKAVSTSLPEILRTQSYYGILRAEFARSHSLVTLDERRNLLRSIEAGTDDALRWFGAAPTQDRVTSVLTGVREQSFPASDDNRAAACREAMLLIACQIAGPDPGWYAQRSRPLPVL